MFAYLEGLECIKFGLANCFCYDIAVSRSQTRIQFRPPIYGKDPRIDVLMRVDPLTLAVSEITGPVIDSMKGY